MNADSSRIRHYAHKPSPRYKQVWFVRILLVLMVVVALVVGGWFLIPEVARTLYGWIAGIIVILLLALGIALPLVEYAFWSYELNGDHLMIARGWLYRHCTAVPLERVQFAGRLSGPLQRLWGVESVQVRTAARSWIVPSLEHRDADQLSRAITRRAREADDAGL